MTEALLLLAIYTAIIRTIRKVFPGALPSLASFGLRSPLRRRFFGPAHCLQQAHIRPGWRVLEIGPGWGFLTREACRQVGPDGEVVGLDLSERMLRRCRRRVGDAGASLHCVRADGAHLPFGDNTFDAILMASVLGGVHDRHGLFGEVARCLKPGAAAIVNEIVLDPDFVFPWTVRTYARVAGLEVAYHGGNPLCHTTRMHKPAATDAGEAVVIGHIGDNAPAPCSPKLSQVSARRP